MGTKTLTRKEELLQGLSMFRGLSPKELRTVSLLVDETSQPAGTVLMEEGRVGTQAFILVEGSATATIGGTTVGKINPGDAMGEMALLDHAPRSATVTADTPVSLLVLTPQTLDQLLTVTPVARAIVRTMSKRLRAIEGAPQHW
jgi:CRP/FNR family transcriptional regulator, cyclic AMP receptor protein